MFSHPMPRVLAVQAQTAYGCKYRDMHHCIETLVQQGTTSETLPASRQIPLSLPCQ